MTFPGNCAVCGMDVRTDAEAFLHACLHSRDPELAEWGNPSKLGSLPYILYPVIAKVMELYKKSV